MRTLPKHFTGFQKAYPDVASAYEQFGAAVHAAGPLDARTRMLVKCAIAIAAGLEGGTHAQVRKALDAGVTAEELHHVALLAMPTVGFPAAMAALSWIDDLTAARRRRKRSRRT